MTLVLSGRIQAEHLPELKRVMESYSKPVVLDLKGLKLVDRDAVTFLADFETDNGRRFYRRVRQKNLKCLGIALRRNLSASRPTRDRER